MAQKRHVEALLVFEKFNFFFSFLKYTSFLQYIM